MHSQHRSKDRRRLVVNKGFQLSFVLVTVLITVIICNLLLAYGFVFYEPLLNSEFDYSHAFGIASIELIVIALAFAQSVITSKNLAGPTQGTLRVAQALGEGDLTARVAIRKNEYFRDVILSINQSLDRLEQHVVLIKDAAADVQCATSSDSEASARVAALNARLGSLRTAPGIYSRVEATGTDTTVTNIDGQLGAAR
jgi:methyl-accepting chemotaxis protein